MTKLTTERLEEIAKLEITEFSNGMDIAKDAYQSVGSSEIVLMARQLLAYEQAAKNPVAWVVGDEEIAEFKNGREVCVMRDCDDEQLDYLPLYAAPVLPKQPELIGMKVSIDTGSDNIGHRLFGEIVGTSDSNGVPVLCIEVAENNGDMAAPAQPVIPERPELRYGDNVLWFLNELAAFDASDIDSDDFDVYGEDRNGIEGCANISITELAADAAKLLSAQPVSEPYKLPVRYFSYGSECGFDWHNTEKEAIEAAEAVIDDYRGDACDGWSEETDSVCWGVILQQATKVDERPRTDDDKCDPAIDTVCDYALLPELVGNSPVIPDGWKLVPVEPTAAMFHAFNDCDYGRKSMRERYIQMIEAAPAQESE